MDLSIILALAGSIIGLVTILIGIWITARLAGKLKTSLICIIFAAAMFFSREMLWVFNLYIISNLEIAMQITSILAVIFILLATVNIKQMIDGVDNHYGKK